MRLSARVTAAAAAALAVVLLAPLTSTQVGAAKRWKPRPGQDWQWMLNEVPTKKQIKADRTAKAWDIDGFDADRATVRAIHARGAGAVCYLSAGSWERWRPDAKRFPASVRGRALEGWPGERWLDIRKRSVLGPIMADRMRMCRAKGFDAVEPDNVDGYVTRTGFRITGKHQLRYNRMLARTAHRLGLAIGLKNDIDQVRALAKDFDFAINEQCHQYRECGVYEAFRKRGKAVWIVEYGRAKASFCPSARRAGYDAMRKRLSLGYWRSRC